MIDCGNVLVFQLLILGLLGRLLSDTLVPDLFVGLVSLVALFLAMLDLESPGILDPDFDETAHLWVDDYWVCFVYYFSSAPPPVYFEADSIFAEFPPGIPDFGYPGIFDSEFGSLVVEVELFLVSPDLVSDGIADLEFPGIVHSESHPFVAKVQYISIIDLEFMFPAR